MSKNYAKGIIYLSDQSVLIPEFRNPILTFNSENDFANAVLAAGGEWSAGNNRLLYTYSLPAAINFINNMGFNFFDIVPECYTEPTTTAQRNALNAFHQYLNSIFGFNTIVTSRASAALSLNVAASTMPLVLASYQISVNSSTGTFLLGAASGVSSNRYMCTFKATSAVFYADSTYSLININFFTFQDATISLQVSRGVKNNISNLTVPFNEWYFNLIPYKEPTNDPYNPGGFSPGTGYSTTDPIGGGGDFNNESDPIPEATVPTISAVDCGFVTLYNPTLAQLNDLSAYMWSPLFTVETLKKIFADPMDIILGLMIVPVDVPAGITQEVTVGGFPTGVQMTVAGAQYIEKDCGSITFTPFFGSYLDYSPYTKMQLFLPYIGTVEINPDEVMGRTVNVKYIVDIATGACTAFLRITGATGRATNSSLLGPLYSFAGQCCQPVPVTGTNWNQLISSVVQVATTAISAGVGAAGAAAAAAAATQVGSDLTPTFAGQNIGDTSIPYREEVGSFKPVSRMRTSTGEGQSFVPSIMSEPEHLSTAPDRGSNASPLGLTTATDAIAGLVNSVMSGKISVGHSGSLSSVSGMIGIKTPFFIITRPNLTLAETYRELHGYPANATQNFSGLSGFTKVEGCRLNNMTCLTPELNEIYGWLKEGVVF